MPIVFNGKQHTHTHTQKNKQQTNTKPELRSKQNKIFIPRIPIESLNGWSNSVIIYTNWTQWTRSNMRISQWKKKTKNKLLEIIDDILFNYSQWKRKTNSPKRIEFDRIVHFSYCFSIIQQLTNRNYCIVFY